MNGTRSQAREIWEQLNQERPGPRFLTSLLEISKDLQDKMFRRFSEALAGDLFVDDGWALMHWTRFAALYHPEASVRPVLSAVRKIISDLGIENAVDSSLYDALSYFLLDHIKPHHEGLLIEEWEAADDEEWQAELLEYLAVAQTKDTEIIDLMVEIWDDDLVTGSFYLSEYPHPRLIERAEESIEALAPWYKYIWSKQETPTIEHMDWIEITSAWAKARFPKEERRLAPAYNPLEELKDWIKQVASQREIDDDQPSVLLADYTMWHADKVERFFLSTLPVDWRQWLITHSIGEETREEFMGELIDAGLLQTSPVDKNIPCPCGSGKMSKRCCYA